jgi:hypothetical protein
VTEFGESNAEISPDGRWLAYQANASGQDEVYVQPFPLAPVDAADDLVGARIVLFRCIHRCCASSEVYMFEMRAIDVKRA